MTINSPIYARHGLSSYMGPIFVVVLLLLFHVHGKQLRSCRVGQLT